MVFLKSIHRGLFFNRATLHLGSNSLKNVSKGMQFSVKLFVIGMQLYLKKECFHKEIFKTFDHMCGIAIFHHSFYRTTTFVEHPSKAASLFSKSVEILMETFKIIRKVPCYQSSTALRTSYTVEVRIFMKSLEKLYGTIIRKNIFNFKWFIFVVWQIRS